jgi:hypothetical protein
MPTPQGKSGSSFYQGAKVARPRISIEQGGLLLSISRRDPKFQ